jgi:hypothetical protein
MIIALTADRLLAIYPFKFFAAGGGLAAYGPEPDGFRPSATAWNSAPSGQLVGN